MKTSFFNQTHNKVERSWLTCSLSSWWCWSICQYLSPHADESEVVLSLDPWIHFNSQWGPLLRAQTECLDVRLFYSYFLVSVSAEFCLQKPGLMYDSRNSQNVARNTEMKLVAESLVGRQAWHPAERCHHLWFVSVWLLSIYYLLTLVYQPSLHGRQRLPLTCSGSISSTATADSLANSSFGPFLSALVRNVHASC